MEAWILDQNATSLAVLDTFQSFIWTDRYRGYGDFEIYMPAETSALSYLKEGNYLVTKDSDRMMIIEDIQVDTDAENRNHLTVTGRSLESILCRRVIWGYKVLNGNFQDAIRTLLNENVIAPSNSKRKIPNFVFRASTDTRITGLTVDTQFLGENLYDAILSLCEEKEIGFRVLPDGTVRQVYFYSSCMSARTVRMLRATIHGSFSHRISRTSSPATIWSPAKTCGQSLWSAARVREPSGCFPRQRTTMEAAPVFPVGRCLRTLPACRSCWSLLCGRRGQHGRGNLHDGCRV